MRLGIPWQVSSQDCEQPASIKFTAADGESYKIFECTLNSFDLGDTCLVIPWQVSSQDHEQPTSIKFTTDGKSYKIFECTLNSFDLGDIPEHVASFKQKICQAVTDQEQ